MYNIHYYTGAIDEHCQKLLDRLSVFNKSYISIDSLIVETRGVEEGLKLRFLNHIHSIT